LFSDPEVESVRAELNERLANWQPPEGSDPEAVADMRADLQSLLDHYHSYPGQSVDDAVASLRYSFEDRVHDFVQDQKIEALLEERDQLLADQAAVDTEVDSLRDELEQRLADWDAPEGADPDAVAEMKEDLQGVIDRFRALPGQSADDALADLRARFNDRVKDFAQDQKLDAVVTELSAEDADQAAVATEVDTLRGELEQRLADWEAPPGADPDAVAQMKEDLQGLITRFTAVPGQSADDALADLRSRFNDRVKDFAQDQKLDAVVEELGADTTADAATDPVATDPMTATPEDAATEGMTREPEIATTETTDAAESIDTAATTDPMAAEAEPGMETPDPRVTMPQGALTDTFDEFDSDLGAMMETPAVGDEAVDPMAAPAAADTAETTDLGDPLLADVMNDPVLGDAPPPGVEESLVRHEEITDAVIGPPPEEPTLPTDDFVGDAMPAAAMTRDPVVPDLPETEAEVPEIDIPEVEIPDLGAAEPVDAMADPLGGTDPLAVDSSMTDDLDAMGQNDVNDVMEPGPTDLEQ
jgi:hypothetical protein